MIICGSYKFEFSVSKDRMDQKGYNKGGGSKEGSGAFMSNTNRRGIENLC
jgi:hypothetical protein